MLGLIARCDDTGLGYQTWALCRMLKPDKILLIDSSPFNESQQHPERYDGFTVQNCVGFPTKVDSLTFMKGLTHLITAETIYNPKMYELGIVKGTKVFTQLNWEFLDHLHSPFLPKPYVWLMPSYWHLAEMQERFQNVLYLPPPIIMSDFRKTRDVNLSRSSDVRKFLHVVGKPATMDRNGTLDVLEAVREIGDPNLRLNIHSQFQLTPECYMLASKDPRIKIIIGNVMSQEDLYRDYDAMILPRRYGGLCLPMNEALSCALPVIMTGISPNDRVLPRSWLVPATKHGEFKARSVIDVYRSNIVALADKIYQFVTMSQDQLNNEKTKALSIAVNHYSSDVLKPKYVEVMGL